MCGRFSLGAAAATLAAQFDLAERPDWTPRYDLAPTQDTLTVLRLSPEGRRECRRMRWGLIWKQHLRGGHFPPQQRYP